MGIEIVRMGLAAAGRIREVINRDLDADCVCLDRSERILLSADLLIVALALGGSVAEFALTPEHLGSMEEEDKK